MKIVTAIAAADEVESLIAAGAGELYCGVVPDAFVQRGQSRLNRRYESAANVRDLESFAALVRAAAAQDVPVAATLNEHAYDPAAIPALVELAAGLAAAGAHALIVADVALILAIRAASVPIDIHLSSVATCTNSESAAFFADIGVQRVILPRYLSTRQIAVICGAGVPVDYEVFVINDGCGFEEGLCLNVHRPFGPMCQVPWRTELRADPDPSPALAAQWRDNWKAYRYLMGFLDHPGGSLSPAGFPLGPCGVCALPALKTAGVGYVKVPGREYSPALRCGGLRLVKTVLDWVERGDPPEAVVERARALKATPLLCESGYLCYFREDLASGRPAVTTTRSLTLADLAAAREAQRGDEGPSCDQPHDTEQTAPPPVDSKAAPPPAAAAVIEVEPEDPATPRLRRIGRALATRGITVQQSGSRLELSFPDDAQPGKVSLVTLARVDGDARCFAQRGDLGLWYAGHVPTPRILRVMKLVLHVLGQTRGDGADP